jgi:hypothetical protein
VSAPVPGRRLVTETRATEITDNTDNPMSIRPTLTDSDVSNEGIVTS